MSPLTGTSPFELAVGNSFPLQAVTATGLGVPVPPAALHLLCCGLSWQTTDSPEPRASPVLTARRANWGHPRVCTTAQGWQIALPSHFSHLGSAIGEFLRCFGW